MKRAWCLLGSFVWAAAAVLGATALQPTQEGLVYGKAGNEPLKMDYYAGTGVGARPIALLVHGGSGSEELGADLLAPAGYDVFSITYQPMQQHPVQDVERAIRYVRFHAREWNGDARKVALIGVSAGGYFSTTVGLDNRSGVMGSEDAVDRESARVEAVVAIFGMGGSSGSSTDQSMRALLDPMLNEKSEEASLARSSPAYLNPEAPPFLLMYSDKDASPTELPEALRKVGLRCDVIQVGNETSATAPRWERELADWLSKMLAHERAN